MDTNGSTSVRSEFWDTDKLEGWKDNPRTVTAADMERLKNQIQKLGAYKPLIINKDGIVLGGNMRFAALKSMGVKQIWVSVVDATDPDRMLEFALSDNDRVGSYDDQKLAELVASSNINPNDYKVDIGTPTDLTDVLDTFGVLGDTEPHAALNDRFVVPPFSVLDTKQGYWQERKRGWNSRIGDNGESRQNTLSAEGQLMADINNGVSILDPVLAEVVVKWWGMPGGHVYDPFAGDSVFGFVAASLGMVFTGTEIRPEQAKLNQERVDKAELEATYICADAMDMDKHVKDGSMDLIFSCPPYADLEVYSDLPGDLSTMSTDDFFKVYATVLSKTYAKLKNNRFAVVTIGEVRNKKGEYISLVPKTIEIMQAAGYTYYNELILVNAVGTLPQRVGRSMRTRKVGKQHQNVLVFYKGSIPAIKENYAEIENLMEFTTSETTDV